LALRSSKQNNRREKRKTISPKKMRARTQENTRKGETTQHNARRARQEKSRQDYTRQVYIRLRTTRLD
jgi:hypothetical protein